MKLEYYNAVMEYVQNNINDSTLKEALCDFLVSYCSKLKVANAGEGHHAEEGGLLRHVHETLQVCELIRSWPKAASLNYDVIISALVLHDIGKIYVVKDRVKREALIGHSIMSQNIANTWLSRYDVDETLSLEIQHSILAHMNEVVHPIGNRPAHTIEAIIVHLCDSVSAYSNLSLDRPELFDFIGRTMYTSKV